jgi:hypothetical protein
LDLKDKSNKKPVDLLQYSFFTREKYSDQMEEDLMGRACNSHGRNWSYTESQILRKFNVLYDDLEVNKMFKWTTSMIWAVG